jgi:crossover junction endodeoxyribonuclease RuvC
MIILGIDPGTLITGYGIIESTNGRMKVLTHGAIRNDSRKSLPLRLKCIYESLAQTIARYHPDQLAIETAFYGKNAQSALKLGHARGVAMLAAVIREIPTSEYSPREVKKAIVGKGNASKQQVQYMVKSLLHMKEAPKYYDATDALAVAVCHLHRTVSHKAAYRGWKEYVSANPERLSPTRMKKR